MAEETLEKFFEETVVKPNIRKIEIPNPKEDEILRSTLIVANPKNTEENYHYYIDVETGYCMRLHKTDQSTGFSFSPRTEDPIIIKESHTSITVLNEDNNDVYLEVLVPDNYIIGTSEFQPI